ncbi:hypothetical protein [Serratia symbiotica]|uniref:hypothetical protein n=1 Tax=Serratia symbiotica TaxID=138074 RepID=UPI0002D36431|nr:hypothetical protein [Serratia symbiotica]
MHKKVIQYVIENISEDILLEDLEDISGKTRFDIFPYFQPFLWNHTHKMDVESKTRIS